MGLYDKVYEKLPAWGQHAAVSAFGLYWNWFRFGYPYGRYVRDYRRRNSFTETEWKQWLQAQLDVLLKASARYVPYYHKTWSKSEKQAACSGRLEDLPLLEKAPLRDNPHEFLRRDMHPLRTYVFHTSGSTGTPIASIWTANEYRDYMAVREVRSANWAGVSYKMPRATFSGRMVEPNPESAGPFYRFNLIERQVYLSAFHLRPDTAHLYVNALTRHQVRWITGYAVSCYLLGKFILEKGITPPGSLKAIITTSEKVTPKMREVMEEAYQCRVYEEYGTVENTLFASECEHGHLHISPDVGIVEILRPDGTRCAPGEEGEVVATCLDRVYQPFVRFRLGDVASWDSEPCPCGHNLPVIKEVTGRIEDVIISPDGRRMVRFHGIFVDQPNVQEGQIIQETIGRLRVKVVPASGFGQADVEDIKARMKQRLGPEIEVIVETVENIPRTPAGKFKAVISKLSDKGVREAETTGE